MAGEIQKDMADGSAYGVSGTPIFFINGRMLSGAQPFAVFDAAIKRALACERRMTEYATDMRGEGKRGERLAAEIEGIEHVSNGR